MQDVYETYKNYSICRSFKTLDDGTECKVIWAYADNQQNARLGLNGQSHFTTMGVSDRFTFEELTNRVKALIDGADRPFAERGE